MSVGIGKATDIDMMNINSTTANKLNNAQRAKLAGKSVSPERMDEVAREFEAQFISQMLESMFAGIETEGPLGGGEAEGTYRSMLTTEYGKLISRAGGIGVADHVKREMLRLQEVE
jgi:flagellar protein FlgJ